SPSFPGTATVLAVRTPPPPPRHPEQQHPKQHQPPHDVGHWRDLPRIHHTLLACSIGKSKRPTKGVTHGAADLSTMSGRSTHPSNGDTAPARAAGRSVDDTDG